MNFSYADFASIKHFVFDIDGVMTDGSLIVHSDGSLLRTVNIRDGYALQLAVKSGFTISIISGAAGDAIQKRFKSLGIDDIYFGVADKEEQLQQLVKEKQYSKEMMLYMGDDMPDLAVMRSVFLPACPADACEEIKAVSKYISPYTGGHGCVRDVIEKVLKLNSYWR